MGKETIICRCEEVTEKEILDSFRAGAKTIDAIKRRTRAGMGLCQGRTCRRLVSRILSREKNEGEEEQVPPTFRPPIRPVKLADFGGELK